MNTSKNKVIFTADDFGLKESYNKAIMDCYIHGFLTSTCICANGNAYEHAVKEILPYCRRGGREKIDLGVHLNAIEGKSLTTCSLLTDKNSYFNNGFISLLLKSFNKDFMEELETEFRVQTEQIIFDAEKVGWKVSFINSHVHIHAIPNIFKLCEKLSQEYNIPFIRTQNEIPYKTSKMMKPINFVKILVLKFLNLFNDFENTNDFIVGVGYTGNMNSDAIYKGIKKATEKGGLIEVLVHPDSDGKNEKRYIEYLSARNINLKRDIESLGVEFTGISDLYLRNGVK